MSQPKNTTTTKRTQLLTSDVSFCNERHGELLSVRAGVPASEALTVARHLANATELLADRLAEAINNDGEINYMDELRGLGFLAKTSGALIFSVERAMTAAEVEA